MTAAASRPFRPVPHSDPAPTVAERRDALSNIRRRTALMCKHDCGEILKWAALSGDAALLALATEYEALRARLENDSNRKWLELWDEGKVR